MPTARQTASATERLAALRAELKARGLDALVITHLASLRYLFGFSGSMAMAIVGMKKVHFFTNDLYHVQVHNEVYPLPGLEIHVNRDFWGTAAAAGIARSWKNVGFDPTRITVAGAKAIKKAMAPAKLVDAPGLAETLGLVKTKAEVKDIATAATIVSTAYERMLGIVEAGHTERDVANYLATVTRELGSERDAFDIIVVAGKRSAMPHGRASTATLKKGDVVTVDFGACVNGLHSDMTRTFCIGTPKKKIVDVFSVLYAAHEAALERACSDITGHDLDAAARSVITEAGYGDFFRHSLGHGLGYDVHEQPRVAMKSKDVLPTGSVVTIEPGIYLPGEFGMRIEDDVVIGPKGPTILTSAPRELVIV